ncbi:Transcription elongation factor spt-4 [Hirsutella minnesotensis 3608]|uniref:Transcription elongation factor SPT4 n=1 Tax=Hirsutella minnesotensis 3608 TaxID=1043627 RepID=A0A0F7ZKS1_9HYPO|nr:Transcription elongation factor spt-4 [Hirsutella minnesotensis 3608]
MSSSNFITPGQQRYMRACMVCSIVMTYSVRLFSPLPLRQPSGDAGASPGAFASSQVTDIRLQRFRDEGCPNCEEFLHLAGSQDQIESCTSQVFEGLITLANPAKSWVAKWQRLDGYVGGVYAIKVSGQLPDEIRSTLEDEYRIQYIPRDGTETEADS